MSQYRASIEASWRRYLRSAVRQSAMTRGQKSVTVAILNMWLHHRNGLKGYIHPGRAKIAKSANVTEKTVSRTMAVLRTSGVLCVRRRLHGEGQRPTEYTMMLGPMLELCGAEFPEWARGELVEMHNEKPRVSGKIASQMSHHSWAKCPTTCMPNVSPLVGQNVPQSTTNVWTDKNTSSAYAYHMRDDGHE